MLRRHVLLRIGTGTGLDWEVRLRPPTVGLELGSAAYGNGRSKQPNGNGSAGEVV